MPAFLLLNSDIAQGLVQIRLPILLGRGVSHCSGGLAESLVLGWRLASEGLSVEWSHDTLHTCLVHEPVWFQGFGELHPRVVLLVTHQLGQRSMRHRCRSGPVFDIGFFVPVRDVAHGAVKIAVLSGQDVLVGRLSVPLLDRRHSVVDACAVLIEASLRLRAHADRGPRLFSGTLTVAHQVGLLAVILFLLAIGPALCGSLLHKPDITGPLLSLRIVAAERFCKFAGDLSMVTYMVIHF